MEHNSNDRKCASLHHLDYSSGRKRSENVQMFRLHLEFLVVILFKIYWPSFMSKSFNIRKIQIIWTSRNFLDNHCSIICCNSSQNAKYAENALEVKIWWPSNTQHIIQPIHEKLFFFSKKFSIREMRWIFLDQLFMFEILVMMTKRTTLASVRPEDRNLFNLNIGEGTDFSAEYR